MSPQNKVSMVNRGNRPSKESKEILRNTGSMANRGSRLSKGSKENQRNKVNKESKANSHRLSVVEAVPLG